MPSSKATAGYGTLLQSKSTGSFVTIAEATQIDGPNGTWSKIDVTNMLSPEQTEEFILALRSPGEVDLDCSFLPGDPTQKALMSAHILGTLVQYQIIFTDIAGSIAGFFAYVLDFKPTAPVKGKLAAKVKLAITGTVAPPT